jgi:diguanylate cyclase (GGDEF)-like protein
MTPDEADRVALIFAAIVQRAEPFRDLENKVIDASGRAHDTLTSGVPIRDASGACIGFRGVDRDITERKQLEAELTRQAHLDYLTGLNNRRSFMERAEEEFRRSTRYGKMLSVGMIDVDDFKKINDQYGHKVGDAVLRFLAEVCSKTLREVDIVGRMGGEEFAVLMPETHREAALDVVERLRTALASAEVPLESGAAPIRFTVSIGLATGRSADDGPEFLLNLADHALYRAKASGKNRVCMAGDVTESKER